MVFIEHMKFSFILRRSFPHENIELSSAKLQISDFTTKKKILLMHVLNNNGPNIEPCGIPRQISDHLLYEAPNLVLCFFKIRKSNRKLRLPISNPYASNFAINQ